MATRKNRTLEIVILVSFVTQQIFPTSILASESYDTHYQTYVRPGISITADVNSQNLNSNILTQNPDNPLSAASEKINAGFGTGSLTVKGNSYEITTADGTKLTSANEVSQVEIKAPAGWPIKAFDAISLSPNKFINVPPYGTKFIPLANGEAVTLTNVLLTQFRSNVRRSADFLPDFLEINGTFIPLTVQRAGTDPIGGHIYNISFTAAGLKGDGTDVLTIRSIYGNKILKTSYFISPDAKVWTKFGNLDEKGVLRNGAASEVVFEDASGIRVVKTGLPAEAKIDAARFTPDGTQFVVRSGNKTVVIDVKSGVASYPLAPTLEETLRNSIRRQAIADLGYRGLLGREPDSGLEGWTASPFPLDQILNIFENSPEYQRGPNGISRWVTEEGYHVLLGRAPDAAGLAYWSNLLSGLLSKGFSVAQARQTVLNGIRTSSSKEYQNRIAQFGGNATVIEEVTRAYWDILNRAPDPAGLKFWVALRTGSGERLSDKNVRDAFLQSPEYEKRATSILTPALALFYGRVPTADEIKPWLADLKAGKTQVGADLIQKLINNVKLQDALKNLIDRANLTRPINLVKDTAYQKSWWGGVTYNASGNVTVFLPGGPPAESFGNSLSPALNLTNISKLTVRIRGDAAADFNLALGNGINLIQLETIHITGQGWQTFEIQIPGNGGQLTSFSLSGGSQDPDIHLELSDVLFTQQTGTPLPSGTIPTPSNPNFYYLIKTEKTSLGQQQTLVLYEKISANLFAGREIVTTAAITNIVDVSADGKNIVYGTGVVGNAKTIFQHLQNLSEKYIHNDFLQAISFGKTEVVAKVFSFDGISVDLTTLRPFDYRIAPSQEIINSPNGRLQVKDERPIGRVLIADSMLRKTIELPFAITEGPVISINLTNDRLYYVTRDGAIRYIELTAELFQQFRVPESKKQPVLLPDGIVPQNRNAIQFVVGSDLADVTDKSGILRRINLKTGQIEVPQGWTRAASNPNFAFGKTSQRIGQYFRTTLNVMDLTSGKIIALASAMPPYAGSFSNIYDVSPGNDPVVIYGVDGNTVVRRISKIGTVNEKIVRFEGWPVSFTFNPNDTVKIKTTKKETLLDLKGI